MANEWAPIRMPQKINTHCGRKLPMFRTRDTAASADSIREKYYSRIGITAWNRTDESTQEGWKNFVRPNMQSRAHDDHRSRMVMTQLRQKIDNQAAKACFLSKINSNSLLNIENDLPEISKSISERFVYQTNHINGVEEWSRYKPGYIIKGDCLTIAEIVAIALYHRGYPISDIHVIKTDVPVKMPYEKLRVLHDSSINMNVHSYVYHAWIKCSGLEYEPLFGRKLNQLMWRRA